ncbi:MAG TPA: hypothetical protein VNO82_19090 [Solirubrobacteraceae bacterium]|nr:hypothetical protein [Solirubrobacteraceae bacterium]
MDPRQPRRAAVGLLAAAAMLATAAPAAAAPPAPCGGVPQLTDPEGDGHHINTDIVGGWFSDAAGRLQAVVQLRQGIWEPAHEDSDAAGFALLYSTGGQIRYVRAEAPRGGAVRYDHGTWTSAGGFASAGATTGEAVAGSRGSVTIDVPGVPAGTVLARPFALTYDGATGADLHWVDRGPGGVAPDGTEVGADYVAGSCGAPPPGGGPGAVSAVQLSAPRRIVGGGRRTISGRVVPAQAGVPVTLGLRTKRSSQRTLTTRADGTFSVRMRISETTRLRAEAGGIGSQTLTVVVGSKVRIKVRTLRDGDVEVVGRVWPALPGRALLLRSDAVSPRARARPRNGRFAFRFDHLRRGRYQVVFVPSRGRALRSTSNTGVVR